MSAKRMKVEGRIKMPIDILTAQQSVHDFLSAKLLTSFWSVSHAEICH